MERVVTVDGRPVRYLAGGGATARVGEELGRLGGGPCAAVDMLRTRLGDEDDPDLVGQRQQIAQTRQALHAAVATTSRGSRTA